ncbi:MAG: hypothetical protein ACTSXG_02865 [Alphaproteobacteria bacterium]
MDKEQLIQKFEEIKKEVLGWPSSYDIPSDVVFERVQAELKALFEESQKLGEYDRENVRTFILQFYDDVALRHKKLQKEVDKFKNDIDKKNEHLKAAKIYHKQGGNL